MTRVPGSRAATNARHWILHRADSARDEGFILLESVIAITVITIVMSAVGAEFVGGVAAVSQQRAQQVAVQVAGTTVEQIRALDASDLITGRGSTSVNNQFIAANPAVQPWLAKMDQAPDTKAAAGSGDSAVIPTALAGVKTTPLAGSTIYTVHQYLGWCSIPTTGSTDCVKVGTLSGVPATQYLRAVVAVTWTGSRCAATGVPATDRLCSYITSTLVSAGADRTFRVNAGAYPAPVVAFAPDQTIAIGETADLQMTVAAGKGVPPFTWSAPPGQLPAGLSLNPMTGQVTGTTTGPVGSFTSRITVTDAFLRTDYEDVTWDVVRPVSATTPGTQTSTVSTPLSPDLQLNATDGSGPYAWSDATPRTLPTGLTLTASGRIYGTPTAVGASTVTLTVTSGGSTKTVTFLWNVVKLNGASYDFEEASGTTAVDGTGHGYNATLQPGATRTTTGKVNAKALSLTGATNSWAAAPSPVVDTTGSLTIAAWVKLSDLSGWQGIAGLEGTKVPAFILQRRSDGPFTFTSRSGDAVTSPFTAVQSADKPATGAWYHVAGVYDSDANTIELFLDGVSQGTATAPASFKASGSTVMGKNLSDGQSSDFLKGALDDVRFYDRPLTSAEVGALASSGAAGPTGGSVDATSLTGTGARYSRLTTLNLALVKGTDPNGVGTTGAQLFRATAPLTSGTCGTYGTYTQVGADNPVTPFANTVADAACYRYRYRVADTLGNSSVYTSPDIKVDSAAPSAPNLVLSSPTNAFINGSTVFYRPAVGGGFTVTASSTDPIAGVASYAFPVAFGTGWTYAAGALGVYNYTYTANPASPGNRVVTATNNAGTTSPQSTFTVTPDSTPPSPGTLTYPNRTDSNTSVSVGFTASSDTGGSGVASRVLQRDSAPLSGTNCGTYTGFSNVTGGTNPTSPFVDTVTAGRCYRYQYVVTDQVGNTTTATSTSIVKVRAAYADAVAATAGLLNWFRLGEGPLSSDSFTDTSQTALTNHTGELGATWSVGAGGNSARVSSANRMFRSGTDFAGYYTSATPVSANYSVQADLVFRSNITNDYAGVIGRVDPSNLDLYGARWQQGASGGSWVLFKYDNGALTTLATTNAAARTLNQPYRIELEMVGSAIRLYVDGVQTTSATDATISAAGRAGILDGNPSGASITKTDATGIHYDNFLAAPFPDPRVTDSKGSNFGDYISGVLLGAVGAIAGDTDTAVTFDGTNDYASVTRTIQDDFSIEFWFKSTQGLGTGSQWWEGAGMVDAELGGVFNDFGVSLRSDGKVVAGVGNPDVSVVSSAGGYDNGAWHHVVFTRAKTGGVLRLYVDGVFAGTTTGNTLALNSPATINFGRLNSGTNYFAGSLDEIALYNVTLTPTTVTSHYDAR